MIRSLIGAALQPVRDAVDVLEGLTEGEIRTKAIVRLGADVVAGMTAAEIMEALKDE